MKLTGKNKSIILACFASLGVMATGYLSAKCSRKANEREGVKDKVVAYAPAIAAGCATISCIGASTYFSNEEIAALTLACAATAQKYADYRKAVHDNVSAEDEARINEAFYVKEIERLEQELAERDYPREDDDLCEFVDSYSGYTFRALLEDVEDGIAEAQNRYDEDGILAWCDIFYLANNEDTRPYESVLGCGGIPWSDTGIGWSKNMLMDLYENEEGFDFVISLREMKDKPGVYVIDYSVSPEYCYLEY